MRETEKKEERYLRILLKAIETCMHYQPRLGGQEPVSIKQFLERYEADPFYHWMGLDIPEVYKAHRVGGGITSLYRQLGIGCQWLFQQILIDHLGLSEEQTQWRYSVPRETGTTAFIELDACVRLDAIRDTPARDSFAAWLHNAARMLQNVDANRLNGAVFEVRQGYKSRDSKRQNADIQSAASAYAEGYMPVMLLLSEQIDEVVAQRYASAKWLILRGSRTGDSASSTYTFCQSVIGFDLAGFFERHSPILRDAIRRVLEVLLDNAEAIEAERADF